MTIKTISIITAIATVVGTLVVLYATANAAETPAPSVVGNGGNTITNDGGTVIVGHRNVTFAVPAEKRVTRLSRATPLLAAPDIAKIDQPGMVVCQGEAGAQITIIEEAQAYGIAIAKVAVIDGANAGSVGWVSMESVVR